MIMMLYPCFMLNPGHSFAKHERVMYFVMSIALNLTLNSYIGMVPGIPSGALSLVVSVVLVVVKKIIRFIYEAPCLAHDMAASVCVTQARHPMRLLRQERKDMFQQPLNLAFYFFITGVGGVGLYSAYTNTEIVQYVLTLMFNIVVFGVVQTSFLFLSGS